MNDDEKLDALLGRLNEPIPPEALTNAWETLTPQLDRRKTMLNNAPAAQKWLLQPFYKLPLERFMKWERVGMPAALCGMLMLAFVIGGIKEDKFGSMLGSPLSVYFNESSDRMAGEQTTTTAKNTFYYKSTKMNNSLELGNEIEPQEFMNEPVDYEAPPEPPSEQAPAKRTNLANEIKKLNAAIDKGARVSGGKNKDAMALLEMKKSGNITIGGSTDVDVTILEDIPDHKSSPRKTRRDKITDRAFWERKKVFQEIKRRKIPSVEPSRSMRYPSDWQTLLAQKKYPQLRQYPLIQQKQFPTTPPRTSETFWVQSPLFSGRVNRARLDGGVPTLPQIPSAGNKKNGGTSKNSAGNRPQKIIKTAELVLQIKRYRETDPQVDALVGQFGGFFADQKTTQNANGTTSAYLVIRVPQRNFEALYASLKLLGEIKKESAKGDDVTAQYADTEARIRNKKYLEKRLLVLLDEKKAKPKTKMSEILQVEQQISGVREEIEIAQGKLRVMGDQVQFGTIHLRLEEPPRIVPKGQLKIEVKDAVAADKQLDTLAAKVRGEVLERNLIKNSDGSHRIEAIFKISMPRFGTLVEKLRPLGRVAVEDITGYNPNAIRNDPGAQAVFTRLHLSLFEAPVTKPSGSVQIEVKTLAQASLHIGAILKRLGGNLLRREDTNNASRASAIYTVRVPRAEFSALDKSLGEIGRIINKKMTGIDILPTNARLAKVPCELSIRVQERARQLPSATAKISTRDLDIAAAAVQALLISVDGQVKSHLEQRQPNGNSSASYTLLARRSEFTKLLAGLPRLGRIEDQQVRGMDDGEVAGAAADVLCELKLTVLERRAPVPQAVLEIIVANAAEEQGQVTKLRQQYGAGVESNFNKQDADGSHRNVSRLLVPVANFSAFLTAVQKLGTIRTRQVRGTGNGESGGDTPDPNALAKVSVTLIQLSPRTQTTEVARGSITGAFIEGWKSLKATTALIINGLIVMLPWLLLVAGFTYLVRRTRRKRESLYSANSASEKEPTREDA